jgi:MFS transporter, ACS family, tartrate transporter
MILCASSGAAMVLWGLHSDRTGERRWHVVLPALAAAATLACAAALTSSATASLVAIGLGFVAICASLPTFWTLPAAILTGTAAAGGIALINSIGNIGGFVGPVLLGAVKESTGNYALALWILAAILVAVSLIVLGVVRGPTKGTLPSRGDAPL